MPGAELRPYQEVAAAWLRRGSGGVLADVPGLGKTASASGAIADHERVIIAGPSIARSSWVGETSDPARFANRHVTALATRSPSALSPGWYFVHFEILHAWLGYLMMFEPTAAIVDEAHFLRSPKAAYSRAGLALTNIGSVTSRAILTGTPVVNRTMDLWALLKMASPLDTPSFHDFGKRYGDGRHTGYGWSYTGLSNESELKQLLAERMLRRTREEVMNDLPKRTRQVISIDLDNEDRDVYEHAHREVLRELSIERLVGGADLASLTRLLKLTSAAKIPATIEQIAALRLPKLVVFTWFRETAEAIAKAVRGTCIHGAHTDRERKARIRRFGSNAGPHVLVGTYSTIGAAINELVVANTAILHDLWWVPSTLLQAEGRLDRNGQKLPTHFYWMVASGTIDQLLANHLLKKLDNALALGAESDPLEVLRAREGASDMDLLRAIITDLRATL